MRRSIRPRGPVFVRALMALLFVGTFVGVPQSGAAQTSPADAGKTDLSVSPALVDDSLDPGAKYDIQVRLVNQTAGPLAVRGATRELTPEQPVANDHRAAFDASSWFNVQNPEFILLGQQTRTVKVGVAVPPNAEPGGHYATINFDSLAPQAQEAGATPINTRVGVLVLLTVSGDIKQDVKLSGPVAVQKVQAEAGPTSFSVTMRNDGNVHVLPQGKLVVTNAFGSTVKELPLDTGIVLPGTKRTFSTTWEHGPYTGPYKVKAELTAGTGPKLGEGTARFYLLPLVAVVPIAILLIVIILVVTIVIRRRRRRPAGRRFA